MRLVKVLALTTATAALFLYAAIDTWWLVVCRVIELPSKVRQTPLLSWGGLAFLTRGRGASVPAPSLTPRF